VADSIREKIIKDVVSTLEKTTRDNGFHSDIQSVQRLSLGGFLKVDSPSVWVDEGREDKEDIAGAVRCSLQIALAVFVIQDSKESFITLGSFLDPIRNDISRSLMVDRNRSNNAANTTSISWDPVDMQVGKTGIIMVGIFEVIYFHSLGDSTIAWNG